MKKTILLSCIICISSVLSAQPWECHPRENARLENNTVNSISFTSNVNAVSNTDFQILYKSNFGLKPNSKYKFTFNAKSTSPCFLILRFGCGEYSYGNYFIDIQKNISTVLQKFEIDNIVVGETLLPDLRLYFQSGKIDKNVKVDITNILFEEIVDVPSDSNLPIEINVDSLVYDMLGSPYRTDLIAKDQMWTHWGAHEGRLNVLGNFDWLDGARPGQWMTALNNRAVSTWGQIIEDKNGSPEKNIRFQIRNHLMYIYRNQEWVLIEDVTKNFEAQLFNKNEFRSLNMPVDSRVENNENGGGVSVKCHNDSIIHWWRKWVGSNRSELPINFDAIFMRCEIRFVKNDNSVNPNNIKYYAGIGADYYLTDTSTVKSNDYNPGVAISRQKRLTEHWRVFTAIILGSSSPKTETEYKGNIVNLKNLPPHVTNTNTDIKELLSSDIVFYLTSDRNSIGIKNSNKNAHLNIYGLNGSLFFSGVVENENLVSISDLTKGIYIIEIITDRESVIGKFTK